MVKFNVSFQINGVDPSTRSNVYASIYMFASAFSRYPFIIRIKFVFMLVVIQSSRRSILHSRKRQPTNLATISMVKQTKAN